MSSQHRAAFTILVAASIQYQISSAQEDLEVAEILNRPIRALAFPSDSTMAHAIFVSYFFEAEYNVPPNVTYFDPSYTADSSRRRRSIDRTMIYKVIENKFKSSGFPGRDCLLRSICETAESPIAHNGLLGDVMHVIFTPSTSRSEDLPEEIIDAEFVGRNGTCEKFYPLCPVGLFELISTFV